ncbi:MAG: YesL family protein [Lachnospiraceae bacterium]|nr:YesL family protein [Lachnospiraceae bacterium]
MFQLLDRIGHLILLNFIWLLCCLPVITIIPATTAFYYATIKSVRRGRGYPLKEYWDSFRSNLKRGIPLDLVLVALGLLLVYNQRAAAAAGTKEGAVFSMIYLVLLFFFTGFVVYICPVLSRFSIRVRRLARMASGMVFRHLPVTILLVAGTVGCGMLLLSALLVTDPQQGGAAPAAALVLLLPGGWCYLSTFLVEPVLKKYMPPQPEGDSSWYYE